MSHLQKFYNIVEQASQYPTMCSSCQLHKYLGLGEGGFLCSHGLAFKKKSA